MATKTDEKGHAACTFCRGFLEYFDRIESGKKYYYCFHNCSGSGCGGFSFSIKHADENVLHKRIKVDWDKMHTEYLKS